MPTPSRRGLIVGLGLAAALIVGLIGPARITSAAADRSTPVISAIDPRVLAPGNHRQTITVTGLDFQPRLTLVVHMPDGGSMEYKDEAILSPQESSFRVAVLFLTAGKYSLVVTNLDGGTSDPYALEIGPDSKPPLPVIARILPEEIVKNQEPQDLTVEGQNFGRGLKAIVTNPLGEEVADPVVRDVTVSSFKLNVRLEIAGPYSLVVSNGSGAVSNIATIIVK